jgi:penicillin-binding protein 1C
MTARSTIAGNAPAPLQGGAGTPRGGRVLERLRRVAIGLASLALAGTIGGGIAAWRMGPPPFENAAAQSVTVLDRDDVLLRAYTTDSGRWRLPIDVEDVDPTYLKLLFAFEDRRFYRHFGVDPLSVFRVGTEVARHGRLISGSSTLTMQTARLLEGRYEKTGRGKLYQMLRALQLEARLSKREILNLYLRLAPFGGNIEGVRAASLIYLGKEPRRLSLAQAALLVALPQLPEYRRPDKHPEAARRARNRVLARAVELGVIPATEAAGAMAEAIATERRAMPMLAPHLADTALELAPARQVHRLTLSARAQAALETLAAEHARVAGPELSTALLAVDHVTGETIAHVGSAGYLDLARLGAVDMARAVRSPGSTLKPLIYALAFDAGIAHPDTLIEDRPARFGAYQPKNFDHDFQGTVTIREALAKSLNIPAVRVLDALGAARLYGRFTALGLEPQLPKDAEPSLAIALGGLGLRLTDLAALYASLARGGEVVLPRWQRDGAEARLAAPRLVSPVAAWYVADILKNAPPPANARAGQIAYKTGTSYGHRDAWSAGFDGRHTIVAWVGRADGAAVPGLCGRQAAAPLLFDAFARLAETRTPLKPAPHGVVRASGADLPAPLRRFAAGLDEAAASPFKVEPLAIAFPPDRAELDASPADGEPLIVKAEGGVLPLTWLVDGQPIASEPHRRDAAVEAVGRGFVRLSVIDATGRTDRVTVRLK